MKWIRELVLLFIADAAFNRNFSILKFEILCRCFKCFILFYVLSSQRLTNDFFLLRRFLYQEVVLRGYTEVREHI